jgi:hypothetical protein
LGFIGEPAVKKTPARFLERAGKHAGSSFAKRLFHFDLNINGLVVGNAEKLAIGIHQHPVGNIFPGLLGGL